MEAPQRGYQIGMIILGCAPSRLALGRYLPPSSDCRDGAHGGLEYHL
jgi:hypothetical protein